MDDLIARLKDVLGPTGALQGADIGPAYREDFGRFRNTAPRLVMRPASTEQVSAVLALCNDAGQPIVAQGGMTGLVDAAVANENEIAISLERMRNLIEIDEASATMTVEAGMALQTVQEIADEHGLLFPLDIGARGSCTVGGNLSTNAGGNRVIRYGMMRDMVLGLEAVLADGTVVTSLNKMIKNNAGYDLKHLFIGSEGSASIRTTGSGLTGIASNFAFNIGPSTIGPPGGGVVITSAKSVQLWRYDVPCVTSWTRRTSRRLKMPNRSSLMLVGYGWPPIDRVRKGGCTNILVPAVRRAATHHGPGSR